MTRFARTSFMRWARPLVAGLLLVAFGSNSALPGLLHGCGGAAPAAEASAMEGMHHGGHDGHQSQEPAQPCACVDHSCCSVGLVAISTPVVPALTAVAVEFAPTVVPVLVSITSPEFLQPYPVGPPSLV